MTAPSQRGRRPNISVARCPIAPGSHSPARNAAARARATSVRVARGQLVGGRPAARPDCSCRACARLRRRRREAHAMRCVVTPVPPGVPRRDPPVRARSRRVAGRCQDTPATAGGCALTYPWGDGASGLGRGRPPVGAFPVGQGTALTPTPTGRFFVTDRLQFGFGSPYFPFALGLSAHQTHLSPTWIGGDQIAIHPGPMGHVCNGCIHVGAAAIGILRRIAPLGTYVIVRG